MYAIIFYLLMKEEGSLYIPIFYVISLYYYLLLTYHIYRDPSPKKYTMNYEEGSGGHPSGPFEIVPLGSDYWEYF